MTTSRLPRDRFTLRGGHDVLAGRGWAWPTLPALAALVLALLFGIGAGLSPTYAIAGVLGIGFVVAVFVDLPLGVSFFAFLTFLESLSVSKFAKVAGLLLLAAWALRRSTRVGVDTRTVIGRHPRIFAWIMVLLVYSLMSAAWAVVPGVAITYTYHDVLQLLLIPIIYSAVDSREDAYKIIAGFLAGAVFSACYGFLHPVAATAADVGRAVGTIGDANEEAAALVAAMALAAGLLIVARRSTRVGWLVAISIIICLIGTIDTLSRSGLLALFGLLLAAAIAGGRWRGRARVALVVVGAGVVVYFFAFAGGGMSSRVTSTNTDGRSDIWTVGWRMFEANPVIGVGAGNFQQAAPHYLERPGLLTAAQFIIVTPKVAHNIYLEQAATLGIPGFIIMMAIFIGGIVATLRAAHIFERIDDIELELVARCCALAIVAYLVSDFFISGLQTKQFWIAFGLGLAMAKLAQTEASGTTV